MTDSGYCLYDEFMFGQEIAEQIAGHKLNWSPIDSEENKHEVSSS